MTRHWTPTDFRQTGSCPAYDGKGGENRWGYCAKCGGDMQSFAHEGHDGPLHHHHSHKYSRAAGFVVGLKLLSVVAFMSVLSACTTVTLRTPNCEASFEHIVGITGVQRMETSNCYFEIGG